MLKFMIISWTVPSSRVEVLLFNLTIKMFECLGIEAARSTIINEMESTMGHHGIHVDRRHLMMLECDQI